MRVAALYLGVTCLLVASSDIALAAKEYVVGGNARAWQASGEVLSGMDTDSEAGWMQAEYSDPETDILPKVVGSSGRVYTATGQQRLDLSRAVTDGQPATGWQVEERRAGESLVVDLGVPYIVNRIVFSFGSNKVYAESDVMRSYEIYANNGEPTTMFEGEPIYSQLLRAEDNDSRTVDRSFSTQTIRYIKIRSTSTQKFLLAEMAVYGIGYVPQSSYLAKVIDLGRPANFGDVGVVSRIDRDASLVLRTRSGDTPTPTLYYRLVPGYPPREEETNREAYERLPANQQGRVVDDIEHWSGWSTPYAPGGGPYRSPGNCRYLQFRLDFRSNAMTDRAAINTLSIMYSQPLVAETLVAEILPAEVPVGEVSSFTYYVRPKIVGDNTGFDAIEIRTPFPAIVDEARIDGIQVGDLTSESYAERLVVRFPRNPVRSDGSVVEVDFRSLVTVYGTTFSGRASIGSGAGRGDVIWQDITPGDATPLGERNAIWVMTTLDDVTLAGVSALPNPFTPNADGVNDVLSISYSLLKVARPVVTKVRLYSPAGRLVRTYAQRQASGVHTVLWDGRNGNGVTVEPGIYVYDVGTDTDSGGSHKSGTVAVAY